MPRPRTGGLLVTRRMLNRALLARQLLLGRVSMPPLDAIEHLVGLQGQTPQTPYTALWSRLHPFDPANVSRAIEGRALVRTGLMRTTLHLVHARDALALWPLTADVHRRTWSSTAFRRRTDDIDRDAMVAFARQLLEERPRTGAELRRALAARFPDGDAEAMALTCRYLLPLVQVPPRGLWRRTAQPANTTLEAWLAPARLLPADPDPIVRRYLAAFGPATVGDMRTWSWMTGLREVVERIRPSLVTYRDEAGRELFDVPDGVFVDPETPAPPRFLPDYDNVLLSHEDRTRVIPGRLWSDSWLFGGLLVDGFLGGTWKATRSRGAATLLVRVPERLRAPDEEAVAAEGERLLEFLEPEASPRDVQFEVAQR